MEWRSSSILFHRFEVSEMGDVRSVKTMRVMKKTLNKKWNRYYVTVSIDGKIYCKSISRLVATEFVHNPNPELFKVVNHINGNARDNSIGNLEWCTQHYNIIHAYDNGLKKRTTSRESRMSSKPTRVNRNSRRITQLSLNGDVIGHFKSFADAMRKTGIPYSNIWQVCKKQRKHAGGYIWDAI